MQMSDWRNACDLIVNKIKSQLYARGVDNIEALRECIQVRSKLLISLLKAYSKNKAGSLSKHDFCDLLAHCGIFLST